MKINILVGTMTGTAQLCAQEMELALDGDDVQVKTLTDAEVTERGIAAEFERLSKVVKARDVFVLFVGGHGRSIAGEGWYYIPQDLDLAKGHTIEKNAIGPGKLAQWLAKVPAQKSLIVLDACESGASEAFRSGAR